MIYVQLIWSGFVFVLGLFSLLVFSVCMVGLDYWIFDIVVVKIDVMVSKFYDCSCFESLWWKQFDDLILNQLVEQLLSGNCDLCVVFVCLCVVCVLCDDVVNDCFLVVISCVSVDIGKGQ